MAAIVSDLKYRENQTIPSEIKDKESYLKFKKFLSTGDYKYIRPPVKRENSIRRNDLCSCGSGKKYKKCCLLRERES